MIAETLQICVCAILGAFTTVVLSILYLILCYVCKLIERILRGNLRLPK